MSTPMPPEEPFEDETRHRMEEEAEEHVEEVLREHAVEHEGSASPASGSERGDRSPSNVPWWRRLFRRS